MNMASSQPSVVSPATQRVEARRVAGAGSPFPSFSTLRDTTLEQDLAFARVLARAMDSQFQIGPIKFGLDAVIGLVPVAGDAITLALGLYPIAIARKHKLGKLVIARMAANLGLDFLTGLVPIAGDAVDVLFKAQLKNLALLEKAAAKKGIRLDMPGVR